MDRFAIYRFSLCWEVPAGTSLFMQLLVLYIGYNLMKSNRMLNCSHSWCKEVFQNSPGVTFVPSKFPTLSPNSWIMSYIYIYIYKYLLLTAYSAYSVPGTSCHLQFLLRWNFQLELGYLCICWQGDDVLALAIILCIQVECSVALIITS